jgi:two-component system sensor histidine kinase BaeS
MGRLRHSLLVRLLALSLGVAVLAIAMTAWLISQDTSQRLRGEFERTMDADSFVLQQLLSYGQENQHWDDVEPLLGELSARTGQRIALTDLDGNLLADSADAPLDLPQTPAAEVDPRTMFSLVTEYSAVGGVAAQLDPGWGLTEYELAEREELAAKATQCLVTHFPDGDIVVGPDGQVSITMDDATVGAASDTTSLSLIELTESDCLPPELSEPSAAVAEITTREQVFAEACVRNDADDGLGYVDEPTPQPTSATTLEHGGPLYDATSELALGCTYDARVEAVAPYVAEPALLYLGVTDRFDPFSGNGVGTTLLTASLVITLAAGVTVLAGRRLVRPIHALTGAAHQMAKGERSARVPVRGRDEVARLGTAFNAMADSIAEAERQRKAMVSDVAHELRTPLANLRGYLEGAEDGVVPFDAELIGSLQEETTLLQRLIDDLQDLALADAGRLRLHREDIDAADIARQVVAAQTSQANEAGLHLTLDEADAAAVNADPMRIRQALSNLVSNAVQYTPAGGSIVVSVDTSGDVVTLAVRDTGAGIAAEHLPHLFDRFYRAESSRSRSTGGSGLGLAITKHLVDAHGGTLEVTSAVGRGSTFSIRLPRSTGPSPNDHAG